MQHSYHFSWLNILFIFRAENEGEREGEKHRCTREIFSRTPPTGDLAHNLGMGPDQELN